MRILLIRYGAWGDSIIITPLIRFLKSSGHEVYLHTSETGMKILAGNQNIQKFIPYVSSSVPDEELQGYWEGLAAEHECNLIINMCESIERAISLHPIDPFYNYPKPERRLRCDKNFYEYAFEHANQQYQFRAPGYPFSDGNPRFYRPEIFPTQEEEKKISEFFEKLKDKFVILWGLSGSGLNKTYPWTDYVIGDLLRAHQDVAIVTVGDELSRSLEVCDDPRVIRMCGKWSMRESGLATKYADLVVAPDTGLIHASGCFDTPKICLIGSNTKNNITKHFFNDFSIESDEEQVPCSPCFRIIYQASSHCPIEENTHLPKCMAIGINPKDVLEKIEYVKGRFARSQMPGVPQFSAN